MIPVIASRYSGKLTRRESGRQSRKRGEWVAWLVSPSDGKREKQPERRLRAAFREARKDRSPAR